MADGAISIDRRHQVFVSSTYIDLVEERQAVIQALLELDCIPAGMEIFPAANEDQWTLIREVIDLSDYYIVIVGGRYGSVTAEGISFTEMEYDYAVEQGIPVLGFVHADPGEIPAKMTELDEGAREKLDAFREKVKTRMVKEYRTPDELASVVSRGLIKAMKQHDRAGWVRGEFAMTDAVRAEIAELRAALSEAERRSDLAQLEDQATIDTSFAHGDDEIELTFNIKDFGSGVDQDVTLTFDWDEIVTVLGPVMLDEAPEARLRAALCDAAWKDLLAMEDGGWERLSYQTVTMNDDSWGNVLVQLRALGIISVGTKRRTVSDKSVYWRLTTAGDQYLVKLRAIPRERGA